MSPTIEAILKGSVKVSEVIPVLKIDQADRTQYLRLFRGLSWEVLLLTLY